MNADKQVIEGFGDEWSRFDHSELSQEELRRMFDSYFKIFPWEKLTSDAEGFDLGCGTGRWAKLVAPRVGKLHLVEPSAAALAVATRNLESADNCEFHLATVEEIPLEANSCDFGYSLGVLHHIPDTEAGLRACTAKLKSGAPFLLYLYYRFDNRPLWFRQIWQASDGIRRVVCAMPTTLRYGISQVLATVVYLPLARAAKLLERCGVNVEAFPLAHYRHYSFYVMRNDALDRFGTRLERRFTKKEIEGMMQRAGLETITFSPTPPFWSAVGFRK